MKPRLIFTLPGESTDSQVREVHKAMQKIYPEYTISVSAPREYTVSDEDLVSDPAMADPYDCPHCGAKDSTRCGFQIVRGTVRDIDQDRARAVGCRVMHYTDLRT